MSHYTPAEDLPVLPYSGTSGWAGSVTSWTRATSADESGRTRDHQNKTRTLLVSTGTQGLTWKELAESTGWHHGTASGVLSVLHKAGEVARLTETRDRCAVYVLPHRVCGRATSPHRSTTSSRNRAVTQALETLIQTHQGNGSYLVNLADLVAIMESQA